MKRYVLSLVILLSLGYAVLHAARLTYGDESQIIYATGARQIEENDIVLVNGACGTQTLLNLNLYGGAKVSVKNIGNTNATVAGFALSDTIDGAASLTLVPGESATLVADADDLPGRWFVIH